jgi:addiction module HigA family antidote
MIHEPKRPGKMVKSLCLEPLQLSVSQAAKLLKISRPTFSKLINGHLNITPKMAMRLAIVFNTSEELWINLQAGYDLWLARKARPKLKLSPFVTNDQFRNCANR